MDLAGLAHKRLIEVIVAQFVHKTDAPEVIDVWLRFESGTIGVEVAADWSFRIEPCEPGQSYVMEELGSRVDVISAPDDVPFVRHIGERLIRVVERFGGGVDGTERVGAEFVFDSGAVVAESFGGDLRMSSG
ncbi:hypothetical protein [Nonomuraea jabiensis]|uniref:Uncharacterized protein n=1 Tax=Nonomuraea jabiensis TaxID=882448 RepID=A0A7W9G458_9ACTN|nr:hypothetical protein [Nonomuraea jabiensis]MBB5776914.1 hypothetical protein [Nonomuraea jabiensis]